MPVRPCSKEYSEKEFKAIAEIYSHHAKHHTGSFEIQALSASEMHKRWQDIQAQGWPYLVAVKNGDVVGYAYAGAFRLRPAYCYMVEDSIYVHPDMQRKGVARTLMAELISQCETRGARQMVALIGDSANHGSIGLHRALGFQHMGIMKSVGWKLERWLDVVIMQRALGQSDQCAAPPA